MKSKTNLLIGILSVAVIALSIFAFRLNTSQRKLANTLNVSQVADDNHVEYNRSAVYKAAYLPSDGDDNFVTAAEKTVNKVVHIRTEIVRKGNSY